MLLLLLAVVATATLANVGEAARQPTHAERQAITNALPKHIRSIPVGCPSLQLRISNNPRFAYVGLEFLNVTPPRTRCLRYASNGFFVLGKSSNGWHVIYNGSVWPSCSRHIPRDLVRCRG
jgi:hypothetical protein